MSGEGAANSGDVISGSEIRFLSKDEETYPQLTRLSLDFDFRILTIASSDSAIKKQYLITYRDSRDVHTTAITPAFESLPDLEEYTNDNIIEILHDTLFATTED